MWLIFLIQFLSSAMALYLEDTSTLFLKELWDIIDPIDPMDQTNATDSIPKLSQRSMSMNFQPEIPTHFLSQIKDNVFYQIESYQNGLLTRPQQQISAISRSSSGSTGFFNIKKIYFGYGCYCNFGSNWNKFYGYGAGSDQTGLAMHTGFRGKPILNNHIDNYCFENFQCKSCIQIENFEQGSTLESCDPGQTKYVPPKKREIERIGLENACKEANTSNGQNATSCVIKTCMCDAEFINNIVKFMLDPNLAFDESYMHDRYDHERLCTFKSQQEMEKEFDYEEDNFSSLEVYDMDIDRSVDQPDHHVQPLNINGHIKTTPSTKYETAAVVDRPRKSKNGKDMETTTPMIEVQPTTMAYDPRTQPKHTCCGYFPNIRMMGKGNQDHVCCEGKIRDFGSC